MTSGADLFISTSAKSPCEWNAEQFPFLAPDRWKSYGAVYRVTMPGHLGTATKWTDGPTTIEFTIRGGEITISQDSRQLVATKLIGPLAQHLSAMSEPAALKWGDGIYGKFSGPAIEGRWVLQR